jgi:hypothetical protein
MKEQPVPRRDAARRARLARTASINRSVRVRLGGEAGREIQGGPGERNVYIGPQIQQRRAHRAPRWTIIVIPGGKGHSARRKCMQRDPMHSP